MTGEQCPFHGNTGGISSSEKFDTAISHPGPYLAMASSNIHRIQTISTIDQSTVQWPSGVVQEVLMDIHFPTNHLVAMEAIIQAFKNSKTNNQLESHSSHELISILRQCGNNGSIRMSTTTSEHQLRAKTPSKIH